MTTGDGFQDLADYLSAVEGTGFEVTDVAARGEGGDVAADLSVRLPIASALDASTADLAIRDAELVDGDTVRADLSLRVPGDGSDRGESGDGTADAEATAAGDPPGDDSTGHSDRTDDRPTGDDDRTDDHPSGHDDRTKDGPTDDGVDRRTGGRSGDAGDAGVGSAEGGASDDGNPAGDPVDGDETGGDGGYDPETPAYRDPDRLREVYAAEDTFAAMTEALGADVTPQTVRRHMIRHGIHEVSGRSGDGDDGGDGAAGNRDVDGRQPDLVPEDAETDDGNGSSGTGRTRTEERSWPVDDGDGEGSGSSDEAERGSGAGTASGDEPDSSTTTRGTDPDEAPDDAPDAAGTDPEGTADAAEGDGRPAPDGIGLPEGVGLADLKSSVRAANTLYDVQRDLGLDRERTHRLLDGLDLLDLVERRVSRVGEETPMEEIDERIERSTGD